ncbi:MAG: glycoside hydrolase family 27 protein [Prolixibacteraceae bacterium]|nr:glycoside hydrolase family 27 protein [Prolixibacteraceae bacterium]
MKKYYHTAVFMLIILMLANGSSIAQYTNKTSAPLLGWNSYDCYGIHINEKLTHENMDAFIQKLKPYGYEYFVLDAGWWQHFDLKPGEIWPTDGDKRHLAIDEYGRLIPSEVLFPNGFNDIIDKAHKYNIKFGLHMMRGIPREAVEKDLPIKETNYSARDIANVSDTCRWSNLMYGVDMDKPGAQEYYNSVLELMAGWEVDFIKYDDIVHKPKEINGVADAIENSGRNIMLSISPGNDILPEHYEIYSRAEMIRISRDIWDLQEDIDISFERWEQILPYADKGFWLDMDMIPFGHIRIWEPLTINNLQSSRGYERMDNFSYAQKKTFITQRAMAASPLFMGGALTSSPQIVFELITNADMLACNQNGVTGELVTRLDTHAQKVDVWKTNHKTNENEGWIGIFNRNSYKELIKLNKHDIGLDLSASYHLYDIWGKRIIEDSDEIIFEIPGYDVIFFHFKNK